MAQISCPNCDTIHEMDDALLSAKPRRMRCASCRSVFVAVAPGTNQAASAISPPAEAPSTSMMPDTAEADVAEDSTTLEAPLGVASDGQIDFDSIDMGDDMPPPAQGAPDAFEAIILPEPPADERDPAERAAEAATLRHQKALEESEYTPPPAGGLKKPSTAVILMAGGLWSLMTICIFRNEIARLVPETLPIFSTVGLDVNRTALDIQDIKSKVSVEEGQETLEISGRITNRSRINQQVPVLRLALRNPASLEVYVWTSMADKTELAGGESIEFRRRLASPPSDAQSVMVRFVAKDDIVSSIR